MPKRCREIAETTNPTSEIVNLSCSHSTPSGDESVPPDIRNWFSSYVYESPVLGSEDKLGCFDSEANQVDDIERKCNSEKKIQLETEVPSSSSLLPSHSDLSEPPDIRNWFSSYVYESPILDIEDESNCFTDVKDRTENVDLSKKQNQLVTEGIQDDCLGKGQSVTKVSDEKSFGCKLMELNNRAAHENTISCVNDDYKVVGTKGKSGTKEADCISNASPEISKKSFSRMPLSSNGDANKENESVTNGFISTKKNNYTKENDRNFLKACQGNRSKLVRKPDLKLPLNESHSAVRRPLHEKTNLQYKMAVPETTAKWRCPQRSKPDRPPLKQLRLEQWVRRV